MKSLLFSATVLLASLSSCVVNPDADKSFRDGRRKADSAAVAEGAVQQLPTDTGQYAMPVAPIAPGADMPVVNPADSGNVIPK